MPAQWFEDVAQTLSEETAVTFALVLLVVGVAFSYLTWRWVHVIFRRTGLDEVVEGTTLERGARRFNTSTAGIVGGLFSLSVLGITLLVVFNVARVVELDVVWPALVALLPQVLIAVFTLIVGGVAADRAELLVQERLQSVKLPDAGLIPGLVKYSILYIAAIIALAQVGVAIAALLVLLAAYTFGIVLLGAVAFKDLLASGAVGIYLLLNEPYSIGDEVRIDGNRGVVQEIDMFMTRIEVDGEEHILPNQQMFRSGIVRVLD